MATQNEHFREIMKDILVHKEDLESNLQTALEEAKNKEDLAKLSTTVKKMEKLLEEIRSDIEERISSFVDFTKGDGPFVKGVSGVAEAEPQLVKKTPLPTPVQVPPKVESLPIPATQTPGPASQPKDLKPAGSRVFHNNSFLDFSKFHKNPHIPDTQRILLPLLSYATTEECLYKFFSNMGFHVVDVKVFTSLNGKNTSGVVGFSSPDAVKQLLQQKFVIDNINVQPRQYYSKEEVYYNNGRATVNPGRFQVFCGGIPTRATLNDVKKVLGQYGKVRDIRMPTVKQEYGSTLHRGFAFVDFESVQVAQALCDQHCIVILGREVEVKPSTKPLGAILAEPSLRDFSSGSMLDLSAALPKIPPLPSQASKQASRNGKVVANGLPKEKSCVICKKNPQNCALLWCGHTETCMDCGQKLKNCPKQGCGAIVECRADVTLH